MGMGVVVRNSFIEGIAALALITGTADNTTAQDEGIVIPPPVPAVPNGTTPPAPIPDPVFSESGTPSGEGRVLTNREAVDLDALLVKIIELTNNNQPIDKNQYAKVVVTIGEAFGVSPEVLDSYSSQAAYARSFQDLARIEGPVWREVNKNCGCVIARRGIQDDAVTFNGLIIGSGVVQDGSVYRPSNVLVVFDWRDRKDTFQLLDVTGRPISNTPRVNNGTTQDNQQPGSMPPQTAHATSTVTAQKPGISMKTLPAEVELPYYTNCYPEAIPPSDYEVSYKDSTRFQLPGSPFINTGQVTKTYCPNSRAITGCYNGTKIETGETFVAVPLEVMKPIFRNLGIPDIQEGPTLGFFFSPRNREVYGVVNPHPGVQATETAAILSPWSSRPESLTITTWQPNISNVTVKIVPLEIRQQDARPPRSSSTSLN
jgi:hypothetical protein